MSRSMMGKDPLATAIATKAQIVLLEALFVKYGHVFHILDASERSSLAWVVLYAVHGQRLIHGWDEVSTTITTNQDEGFKRFYSVCEEKLKELQ